MKKMLCILLIFCLVLVMGACSHEDDIYDFNETDDGTETIDEGINPENGDIGRGLALLREDPTDETDNGFFLLRDGENYTLGTSCYNEYAPSGSRTLYDNIMLYDNADGADSLRGFCSVGYVPVPVLEPGDLVVSYSKDNVPTLGLNRISFYGYATGVFYSKEGRMHYFSDIVNDVEVSRDGISGFAITDLDGNAVSDYYNLNQDENYVISWFEGTQYEETSLVADSKMYVLDSSEYKIDYEIEGSLTKNGYAEYDLSNIPAGTYKLSTGQGGFWQGIITIE